MKRNSSYIDQKSKPILQKSFSSKNTVPYNKVFERRKTFQQDSDSNTISQVPSRTTNQTTDKQPPRKKRLSELEGTLTRLAQPKHIKAPVRNNSKSKIQNKNPDIIERPKTTAVHNLIYKARERNEDIKRTPKIIDVSVKFP